MEGNDLLLRQIFRIVDTHAMLLVLQRCREVNQCLDEYPVFSVVALKCAFYMLDELCYKIVQLQWEYVMILPANWVWEWVGCNSLTPPRRGFLLSIVLLYSTYDRGFPWIEAETGLRGMASWIEHQFPTWTSPISPSHPLHVYLLKITCLFVSGTLLYLYHSS